MKQSGSDLFFFLLSTEGSKSTEGFCSSLFDLCPKVFALSAVLCAESLGRNTGDHSRHIYSFTHSFLLRSQWAPGCIPWPPSLHLLLTFFAQIHPPLDFSIWFPLRHFCMLHRKSFVKLQLFNLLLQLPAEISRSSSQAAILMISSTTNIVKVCFTQVIVKIRERKKY